MVPKSLKDRLISLRMKQGNKYLCENQFFTYLKNFQKNNRKSISFLLKHSLIQLVPLVGLKKVTKKRRRKSVTNYPYVLKKHNRVSLSLRFLMKKEPSLFFCLSVQDWVNMLLQKFNSKNILQKQVIQQKKLLRYRWFS